MIRKKISRKLTLIQQAIILSLLKKEYQKSSDIYELLSEDGQKISLVTVKRNLSEMNRLGFLDISGSGRSTVYKTTAWGRINTEIDSNKYCADEPDKRFGYSNFQPDLVDFFAINPFLPEEIIFLDSATLDYGKKKKNISPVLATKEIERFVIELSWKSSKIEGNTYSLLDTEKLILRGEKAVGKSQSEAQMILNHKEAFKLIYENAAEFKKLTKINLREVHKLLVKDMSIKTGWRNAAVGISGSKYLPPGNRFQVEEAVEKMIDSINKQKNPFAKALFVLLGISYIQPFEDGNKRTARLIANALLLANRLAPLSYRSVEEKEYREAMLVFYELNSIQPFKKIFLSQYKFATDNYLIKPA